MGKVAAFSKCMFFSGAFVANEILQSISNIAVLVCVDYVQKRTLYRSHHSLIILGLVFLYLDPHDLYLHRGFLQSTYMNRQHR